MIYLSVFQGVPERHRASLVEHPGAHDAYGVGDTEIEAKASLIAYLVERGDNTPAKLAETLEEMRDPEIVRGAAAVAEYWNKVCQQAASRIDGQFKQPRMSSFSSFPGGGIGNIQDPAKQRRDYLAKAESWDNAASALRAYLE